MIYNFKKENYEISNDILLLQFDVIHGFLRESYWSPNIPLETVKKAAENSMTFGIYKDKAQVGYARVISDYSTFAYLADVFVLENERGKGLSKWLLECIMKVPQLQNLRRWTLGTRDAHGLYAQFGFKALAKPENSMEILVKDIYLKADK